MGGVVDGVSGVLAAGSVFRPPRLVCAGREEGRPREGKGGEERRGEGKRRDRQRHERILESGECEVGEVEGRERQHVEGGWIGRPHSLLTLCSVGKD